ncbi:MAG: hypothetical protein HQ594_02285, partial [Candidatus Omnitrophica bacterium]|nr:hypothetical protein [Candidatus Omnitrophota bacterium]
MVKGLIKGKWGGVNTKVVAGLVAVVVLAVVSAIIAPGLLKPSKPQLEFQKGIGYVTWSKGGYLTEGSDASLLEVKELGSNWVAVLITWYQTTPWTNDIKPTSKTPSDESVIYAIQKAKEMGMKVMLKPHLDLMDKSDGSWRGEIASG